MKKIFYILSISLCLSCHSSLEKDSTKTNDSTHQIGQYIISLFEDSKGNLWIGTIEHGVAKYNGKALKFFSKSDGLSDNRVAAITEDNKGNIWFGTGDGLSKYDGNKFVNLKVDSDLSSNIISQILIDRRGVFWIGTWNGVYQLKEDTFKPFKLPIPEITSTINPDTKGWITAINEDTHGNIWFGRDGYGACQYDGESFMHYLKKDGLYANTVTDIAFDKHENIWFGTRVSERDNPDPNKRSGLGGVIKFGPDKPIYFNQHKGLSAADVYEIYRDLSNNIWISTTDNGVYKYDGEIFSHYKIPISAMNILEDKIGNIWIGGAGGLYKITTDGVITNVHRNGPW